MQHPITEHTPQADVDRRARLYLLVIFGGILFPNTLGSHVSLRYLPFLEHLDEMGCYSWGAAVLAFMYREFCRVPISVRTDIAAFFPLLQIWVWVRMRPFQPIAATPPLDYIDQAMPYARRWTRGGVIRDVDTHHSILPFRDQLDRITSDTAFIWMPYDQILDQLPAFCRAATDRTEDALGEHGPYGCPRDSGICSADSSASRG
ncbi:protein MAIN-LIKE 2-like [Lycium ferocissimum]|uniref:protein MAIN-LIKE 2-like n=1 Tax=Lycium ferocissimum TaxID=112874 RepID=UPI002816866C|nr:protein MAIN-LIKE 2-like [Lycium ferocissimum]